MAADRFARRHTSSVSNVCVNVAHKSDSVLGNLSYASNGVRAFVGAQAFRGYEWMTDTRAANSVGNFRGMVVSARWATAYQVIGDAADVIGKFAIVASIAANAVDAAPQFEAVYRSKANPLMKLARYRSLANMVAEKTLLGTVTGGVHLIYASLIAVNNFIAKTNSGTPVATIADISTQVLKNADQLVQKTVTYITDPANQPSSFVLVNLWLP